VPAGRLDSATLYDIAPTVLALAGLPLADDMTGVPLLRRAAADRPTPRIATYEGPAGDRVAPARAVAATPEIDARTLRNLAALGYVDPPAGEAAPASGPGAGGSATITAHTNLAAVLLQRGDLPGAEAELRQALARDPHYAPALLMLGQVLGRQGQPAEALAPVRAAIEGTADVEDSAYVQLALLAQRAGRSAEIAAYLPSLRRLRPRSPGVPTAEGLLALHAGAPEAAEKHFRAALAIEPTASEALGQLFGMYRERKRELELEPLVREALARNDGAMLHHNWLGLILARRGDAAGAEAEFRRALELAPDFGGTMANLGSLYGRTGRFEDAVAILSRAVRLEPRNLEAQVNLGAALAKLGRLEQAIATLEQALRLGLRSPELLDAIGLAYAQSGDTSRAAELLRESLALLPDQPQVRWLLEELERDGSTHGGRGATERGAPRGAGLTNPGPGSR
jgi:tetratricopeptide (TPR) repeat protein